jgi:hypothetical protein
MTGKLAAAPAPVVVAISTRLRPGRPSHGIRTRCRSEPS